ncbi:MAG: DPP IV N-terminal domain-containing protein, partial [Candidatus Poribacteria bacterium]|nr:DPP IV N-terminal domain-containing protein [Candidatus Poribacteria bacterium]
MRSLVYHHRAVVLMIPLLMSGSLLASAQILFSSDRTGNREIYEMSENGGSVRQRTSHPGGDAEPTWSPDGSRVAFVSDRNGQNDIFIMNRDRTNIQNVTRDPGEDRHPT